MRGNLHGLYRQAMSRWAVAPGGCTPGVKELALKGTGEARGKPPRSRAWLRTHRDKWHLDEIFLTIQGERHYLWRAVDQDGHVLDILVQRHRHKIAAKKFFHKLLKGLRYVPRVIITDKLKSSGAAKREVMPSVEPRQHRYLDNRAENSHQPPRQRERLMQGFKSSGQAQRFLSAYGLSSQHFRPRRHLLPAPIYRE